MSNSDFYTKWQEDKNFIIDNDKLKDKKYIFSSLPKGNNYGFQNGRIRSLIYGDIISRYHRLQNRNVLFPVGINTLSQASFLESRKQSNQLNDDISNIYLNQMFELGIGINDKKIMNMRHDEYLSNLQLDFIELYDRGYIEYKNSIVYLDKKTNKIYDEMMAKDDYVKTNMKVFVLKIRNALPAIIENINELNINDEIKELLINSFKPKRVMEIPLKCTCDNELKIEIEEPEYLGGVSFILLNPEYIDVLQYVSSEELINVKKYLDDENTLYVYSGNNAYNILTGDEIPILISKIHNCGVYAGIPELDSEDYQLALNEGFNIKDIICDDVLINSDFLNGLDINSAKELIIKEFVDNSIAKMLFKYNHTEILLSQTDPFGALFPFLDDRGKLYSLRDFLPFNFSVQFRPTLDSKTDVPGNQINGTMSNLFTVGMAPILAMLYDEIGSNESIFSKIAEEEYESWSTITNLYVDDEKIFSELLMPIIFNNIIKLELHNIPTLIKNVTLVSKTIDKEGFVIKRRNNNLINFDDLFASIKPDAIRLYVSSTNPSDDMIYDFDKLRQFDHYMRKLKNHIMQNELINENNLDFQFEEFKSKSLNYLENNDILNFSKLIVLFTNTIILKFNLTKKQLLDYLRIIYVIFPYLSEYLYNEIYENKYSIINEGWPS